MTATTAVVTTANASRYLRSLCKHFAHKVEVEYTPVAGKVTLPFGTCELVAGDAELILTGHASPSNLAQMERFLGSHLARFAFREDPEITWHRTA